MKVLLCGSLAYDTIMVFQDQFSRHILPENLHILSVAFLVPEMRREFGGTAGNIAFNLKMLGGDPWIMATVGHDFGPYRQRLVQLGLPQNHILEIPESFTAQAFITTDLADNQITAFHPGAMMSSHHNRTSSASGVLLGVVSPDGREGMLQHARDFDSSGIPFLFDPGQGLPMFSGEELMTFLDQASYLAVNDYEAQLLSEKTGLPFAVLAEHVEAAVVTRGAEGSTIHANGEVIPIPAATPVSVVDPTGCGDAYRAGLIYGLGQGWDWPRTGRLASLMGALKIAHPGGQNHHYTREQISTRFKQAFGMSLDS